ncbi:cytochrome c oxidase subunit 3 [Halolamina salifodinae]|uniref:Cytochrome c oxidase subunit 3 n=1 Tax=Halolamina salifodinae TaxID=1202767 RepID=A0A8T4GTA8_9EURY|nr:cytochrome c oxidase subunit 3 [Halolamina salifodinae]MBP1985630.1 cytochrome c oxidase subunit 3 [Halolamina salifodinae]
MGRDGDDSEFRFLEDADPDATSDAAESSAFEFGDGVESEDEGQDSEGESGDHGPEGHSDHGHHPVVEDWPRGVGEASWWPVVTALGAAAIYVSAALFLLGRGRNSVVGPGAGPAAFVGAVALTLFGVYGWLYHGFLAHFWTRGTDRRSARSFRWAMLAFIASEIATFGALFAYYFYIRAGTWPPANSTLPVIDLLNILVVTNTAVLVLSSVTVHFAHHALASGNRDRFQRLLAITIGLGGLFLAGQLVEYHEFINQEGFDWTSGLFGSAFFGLTGLHGLHVAFGTLLLGITYVRGRQGQFDGERDLSVALVSLYWHFVDAVWIFLVAALYAGASIY